MPNSSETMLSTAIKPRKAFALKNLAGTDHTPTFLF
jgi:hypothetical protein